MFYCVTYSEFNLLKFFLATQFNNSIKRLGELEYIHALRTTFVHIGL